MSLKVTRNFKVGQSADTRIYCPEVLKNGCDPENACSYSVTNAHFNKLVDHCKSEHSIILTKIRKSNFSLIKQEPE